jgi:hypothetical protein
MSGTRSVRWPASLGGSFSLAAVLFAAVLPASLALSGLARASEPPSRWSGIDETVVEKVAAEAGRQPHGLWFEMDQGDLPLFLFLCAGIVGGSVCGYCFRMLFVENIDQKPRAQ